MKRWGEGVDTELEGFEAGQELLDAVELVSPRALGAFDVAVELRPLRRQDKGTGLRSRHASSNSALNSDPPSTWMPSMRKRFSAMSLSRAAAQRAVAAAAIEGDGPLRHRVVSRGRLTALSGATLTKRVSIWTSSPPDRLHGLGPALSVALAHDAQAASTGFRRSIGTGVTTPLAMSFVRLRPTIETETFDPLPAQPRACACPTSGDQRAAARSCA